MLNCTFDRRRKLGVPRIHVCYSIIGRNVYLYEIDGQVTTLEEASDKLFDWSRHNSNHMVSLREWRSLRFSQFKTEGMTWFDALERLHEPAVTLQD